VAVCADVGSTFTKAAAVDLDTGALLATASGRTTVETDVMDGLDAAIAELVAALPAGSDIVTTRVCSSAGGGLRLAVVGYEELVTAEAARRVALSAGARVVHIGAGRLDRAGLAELQAAEPDLVLLAGGTDGGDSEVLRHNAGRLAGLRVSGGSRRRLPVVVAGNVDLREEVASTLAARGTPVVATANVLPRIGQLDPQPARSAIREVFLRHVIGGKRLSRSRRFASLVRGATPEVVLTAVELLADHVGDDLVVVDVGGATTDVYSVLRPHPDATAVERSEVAGAWWSSRTVEGDLGVRWGAPGVVQAAEGERLLRAGEEARLAGAVRIRAEDPAYLPVTDTDRAEEMRIAGLAATIALRRHARGEPARAGDSGAVTARLAAKDLRRVRLFIASGGVLRHAPPSAAVAVHEGVLADLGGGWAPPRAAHASVDVDYVLAPAGLLAADHPGAALALLDRLTS
jgi:uncharacterized protein (TIGR01319 family)